MSSSSLSPDQEQGVRQAPTPEENELSFLEVVVGSEIVGIFGLLLADIIIRERRGWEVVGETFIALCLALWLISVSGSPREADRGTTRPAVEPPQVVPDEER